MDLLDEEILALLISVSVFVSFGILVFFLVRYAKSTELTLDKDPISGRMVLKFGGQELTSFLRTDVVEICQSTFQGSGKNKTTYYTVALVFAPESESKLLSANPKFHKVSRDGKGYRVFYSARERESRNHAEFLAKELQVPVRSRTGEIREVSELDLPFHERMKDSIELFHFPPYYKPGDPFEVRTEREGLVLINHKKTYLISYILVFFTIMFTIVYATEGLWEEFFTTSDGITLVFLGLFHLPILIGFFLVGYMVYRTHRFSRISIVRGILKIGGSEIPLNQLEEIGFDGFNLTLVGDNMFYRFSLFAYVKFFHLAGFVEVLKKCIVYQGMR